MNQHSHSLQSNLKCKVVFSKGPMRSFADVEAGHVPYAR